ncbi:hypothetical protein ACFO5K_14190 [Nocardia halotolerans]|uniref:Uncharacterized protein n=1 Tax=Nocardia halotolerans TaxID=1755878 RepID=A0ABV8VKN2_9NOCA
MKYQRSASVVVLWVLAVIWGTVSLLTGVSSLFGADGSDGELFFFSIIVGVLPLGAVMWHEQGLVRRQRLAAARPAAHRRVPMPPPPPRPPVPQLPSRLQQPWNRLSQAWSVVAELQRQGWIDPASTSGLPQSMQRLHRLAVADGMTDQLGGRRSSAVEQQLERLGDLLVALADEAVEHQATIGADFTPATLAAAAQRLAADRAAYRELMELGGVWGAE